MKIVQLEYFCAVSRYHSITQAAQKFYVTQPAISNAIRELEKEFSINLFTRSKNHLSLTKEGELFYQKASTLLEHIEQTSSQLYDLGKQIAPVRIGIPPLLSTIFFPDMLLQFKNAYPHIPLELFEYGSIRAATLVQEEVMDLALVNMHFYGAFLYSALLEEDSDLVKIPVMPLIEQDIGLVWKKGKYINSSVGKFISFTQKYSQLRFASKSTTDIS